MTLEENRVKREMERQVRFLVVAQKFSDLFIQFKRLADEPEPVDFACSLLKTPSVARIYSMLLEFPHVFSFGHIVEKSGYSEKTVRRALKRLQWFQVAREQEGMWGLNLPPEYPISLLNEMMDKMERRP